MEYYKNLDLADIKYFCDIDQVEKIEEWRDVENYIDIYKISDLGRLKGLSRPRKVKEGVYCMLPEIIRKQNIDTDGYLLAGLRKNGKQASGKIHRLVAKAFIPNPLNLPEVNHIGKYPDGREGNKYDNRVVSLKWDTRADNQKHAGDQGLVSRGEKHVRSKLTEKEVLEIRASSLSAPELGKIYNVNRTYIIKIVNRQRWKHV